MRRAENGKTFFSPSDLVTYLGCPYATVFDLQQMCAPVELPSGEDSDRLLKEKGLQHERTYLEHLRKSGLTIAEIPSDIPISSRVAQTKTAMEKGAQVIYQAALIRSPWNGFADFLLRIENRPSKFGSYSYEVADTKLALSAKPDYVIQLCVYCDLLAVEQQRQPHELHIVLGDSSKTSLRVDEFKYFQKLAACRFETFMDNAPIPSSGEPCGKCDRCRWLDRCEADWEKKEHLSLVANISGDQIKKLRAAGVNSMRELAQMSPSLSAKLQLETLSRLREQARLQIAKRDDGQNRCEVLPLLPNKGFARLPPPTAGDLFFDMEGDPLYEPRMRLEYLFGFVLQNGGSKPEFRAFWAHDRQQEKKTFEGVMDFIMDRLKTYPDAYIYHYANYEETALKNLAMYHGTREAEVDHLLRSRKLVDLFKVVREAVRVSEPRYSIKNMEHFYAEKRAGEVTNAGDSIVMYEKWRQLRDDAILKEISDYNEFDCRSTLMCRDWLLTLRPTAGVQWFSPQVAKEASDLEKENNRHEAEARTTMFVAKLSEGGPEEEKPWRELVGHLLEFHRREAKPQWWAMFNRQEMTDESLVDDAECIGKLSRDPGCPPYKEKRSVVHTYRFPAQDFKMRVNDSPLRPGTLESAGQIISLDDKNRIIALKLGPTRTPLPDTLSLIPNGPIGDQVLRDAIYRYAEAVIGGRQEHYAAITSILRKEHPRLAGTNAGEAIIPPSAAPLDSAVDAVCRLDNSHMLIQGPPGTGKTFTSSHAIVELLKRGKRVGIASNSHKAVNNLLLAVEKQAALRDIRFNGIKKSSNEEQFFEGSGLINNTTDNNDVENGGYQLIAGTAWLFARQGLDQTLDYLFVDEAGQVSLANIVAMGSSAKNIVLVGYQMQLAQPIQGTHPGNSGLSALEYLLGNSATVPEDRGIFLSTTRRMHPQICQFISDAVYDGRLKPGQNNSRQKIILNKNADPEAIISAGLRFVDVQHDGCAQKSEEEANRIRQTYASLLSMKWGDEKGVEQAITQNDILVVTPYNMQVDLLESTLPSGARVGTVDKFQGQEAAVVLISMATSSEEDLPRDIEFLFSRNRLNVAISRARCLAVIYANPKLLEIPCHHIHQMRLVNTLCWAKAYAYIEPAPYTTLNGSQLRDIITESAAVVR
ncbi:MAG: TM0106 family RecB-like putative nuclease [Alphaproteobacteria bacterium]|nr:TM0106 family RecB-like putative nuclease [Alphaproteobacteria bacterium]